MELQLPELQGLSHRHARRPGAHPVFHRGRRSTTASWALVNASPDVLAQLQANPDLQPARAMRDSAIAAIVLVDGQVDHTTGLYMLREATRPWPLWCTDSTFADLTRGNPVLRGAWLLLRRRSASHRAAMAVHSRRWRAGVRWRALPVASKPAPYSPNRDAPDARRQSRAGDRRCGERANGGVCAGLERHR